MPQLQPAPPAALDAERVRAAIDTVFRSRVYAERSLGEIFWDRLGELLRRVRDALTGEAVASPTLFWLLAAVVAVAAVVILARASVERDRRRGALAPRSAPGVDPWRAAEAARGEGRLVDAAHLVCAGVLAELARRQLVRPHPSKTLGDHARELRARRVAVAPAFRAFVARYERFVWASGAAEPAAYDALLAEARALVAVRTTGAAA